MWPDLSSAGYLHGPSCRFSGGVDSRLNLVPALQKAQVLTKLPVSQGGIQCQDPGTWHPYQRRRAPSVTSNDSCAAYLQRRQALTS